MKMKLLKSFVAAVLIFALMFAEYRIIMHSITPSFQDGLLSLEVFGYADTYYVEPEIN